MYAPSPAELALLDRARVFVDDHVRPNAVAWAAGTADSRAVLYAAAEAGLIAMLVPASHGGAGLSFACMWRVAEVLAAGDFGVAMSLLNTHNIAAKLARDASPELAARHVPALLAGTRVGCTALSEPGAGSDFGAITTRALALPGGGWQLDGEKAWITNGVHADLVVLYAQTRPGSGAAGIAAFLVDGQREGFVRTPASTTGVVRSNNTAGFVLQGYMAEAQDMLHPPGEAFKVALTSINRARVYVAAMCCGMVGEALRLAAAYGAQRQTFGQPLIGHQGWRWRLAEAAIDLDAARALIDIAATQVDAGADAQSAAAKAKVFATRMAPVHLQALLHAMGAEGLRDGYPFLRHLAAAQAAALIDGSTEMLLERVARDFGPRAPAP
jgi:alkylation response protein AidB-like acyl-CoA dehydrogenase